MWALTSGSFGTASKSGSETSLWFIAFTTGSLSDLKRTDGKSC
jgi:hypothetical protein